LIKLKTDTKKSTKKKKNTSAEELTKDLPSELCAFIKYTRDLEFETDPNYDYLRGLLKTILEKHCSKEDNIFDWDVNSNSSKSNQSTVNETIDSIAVINTIHKGNNIEKVVTLSNVPRFFDETNHKNESKQRQSKEPIVSEPKNDCIIL